MTGENSPVVGKINHVAGKISHVAGEISHVAGEVKNTTIILTVVCSSKWCLCMFVCM